MEERRDMHCYSAIFCTSRLVLEKKLFLVFHPSLGSSLKFLNFFGNFQPRVPYKGVPYIKKRVFSFILIFNLIVFEQYKTSKMQ